MSTPHPHRGLPPPSAMALPELNRPRPGAPFGVMPAPPAQWQGQEDSMRNWLLAKAEEDKRKQEEERTRQETLRLEQRKIEQAMLRESLQGGVPPQMVPMIYAGIGGANLANLGGDWLQQYAGQLQSGHLQLRHESPEQARLIGPGPPPFPVAPAPPQQAHPSHHPEHHPPPPPHQPPPPGPLQTTFSAYQPIAAHRPPPTSAPRSATHSQLPRLTTNEMYPQHPPGLAIGPVPHPSQPMMQQHDQNAAGLYFHHWQPPSDPKNIGPGPPHTPASREPLSAQPVPGFREAADYKDSPRKRKAAGEHQSNPPPSTGPQYTSPPFSVTSSTSGRKGNLGRSRSNTHTSTGQNSDKDKADARPEGIRDARPHSSRGDEAASSRESQQAESGPRPPQLLHHRLRSADSGEHQSRPASRPSDRKSADRQAESKAEPPTTRPDSR
ncbi:hypothetical protein TI39_contig310g00001 [Zymoseptoria brevis]|uniref:Uncharacterized protein n=1 Tax=Zymoseptoria brevis TaxID=1047168 RepID=A0A0F4GTR2_9PEZI|nr:hypothetical protein TI39_contig310g00001 [Zymoseptoria brevis]